jgi:precorrin-3B methylase
VSKLGYPGLTHRVSCLGTLPDENISEDTLVIIGNTSTFLYNGWMITPRPYQPGLGY